MNYGFSQDYEELAHAVIDALPELWFIRDAEIRIGFLKYVVNPHDREEFDSIISRVGIRWDEPGADVPDILSGNSRAVIPRE